MSTHTALSLPGRPRPYIMAHRGNRALCPENTLASFQQALSDNADILETDLHLTRDGHFVCIHDSTLDRTTSGTGKVEDYTVEELKKYSAGKGFSGFEYETIPLLSELSEILPDNIGLALELKTDKFLNPEIGRKLADQLSEAKIDNRTVLLSFSMSRLLAVQRVAPNLPIGWITMSNPWPVSGPQLIGPFWPLILVNPFYAYIAHRKGQFTCPLDPNPDKRLWLYQKLGFDAILTDNPQVTITKIKRSPA